MSDKYNLSWLLDQSASIGPSIRYKEAGRQYLGELIDILSVNNMDATVMTVAACLVWQLVAFAIMYGFLVYVVMWLPRIGKFMPVRYIAGNSVAVVAHTPYGWLTMLMLAFVVAPIYTLFVMPVALASPLMQLLLGMIGPDHFYSICAWISYIGLLAYEIMFF